jgi:signal transduction histidine kinase/CheY-like chemotaxis protein/GAF domain-containing protein
MPQESVLIVDDRRDNIRFLRQNILDPAGYRVSVARDGEEGLQRALEEQPDLIIIHLNVPRRNGLSVLEGLRKAGDETPAIVMTFHGTEEGAVRAYQLGARQYVVQPCTVEQMQAAVERSLVERRLRAERDRLANSAFSASAQAERRLRELDMLAGIGKSITALLDEERLMGRVVDAAVYLTGAQEGALLVVDEDSGELSLRAVRGSSEQAARQFQLEVGDSLAKQVVQTGKPVFVSGTSREELSETRDEYPVRPLIQVPLKVGEWVFGVLSVDHPTQDRTFSSHDLQLLSTLADSAAIALEHARLHGRLRAQPPAREEPETPESVRGVLDGLEAYRDQVRTCIQSARMILTDLREQAASLEARLVGIAPQETGLLTAEDLGSAAPAVRSERTLKSILDTIRDGVLVVGEDDKIELANQAASVMLGRALAGQEVDSVCDDPRWSKTYDIVRAAVQIERDAPGSELTSATTALAVARSVLEATFQAGPAPDRGSSGTVVVLRDMSGEREAERAKDSFVRSLSQELRTPMTSIGGYAELLLSGSVGSLSDAQAKLVRRIRANAERVDGLLEDLTRMAIVDSGQLQLKDEVVDLTASIYEACGTMRAQMAQKDQIIELNLDPNLPQVQVDADAMFHILTSLLQNAYQCSPQGACIVLRAVKMRAAPGDGDDLYVAVSVADEGGGIAPADHRRVFNRHDRLDAPSVSGLGDARISLPIVKVLVEANGGRIWLDSTPGTGSTFTVVLPVGRRALSQAEPK